jgi:hypothetical protein
LPIHSEQNPANIILKDATQLYYLKARIPSPGFLFFLLFSMSQFLFDATLCSAASNQEKTFFIPARRRHFFRLSPVVWNFSCILMELALPPLPLRRLGLFAPG